MLKGGDVLKFIGDGVLAVFPADHNDAAAAAGGRAMEAAKNALANLDQKNGRIAERWGGEPLAMAASIDIGDVIYGNIGGRSRLDFTVIGPAVNRESRILDQAKRLEKSLVVSAAINDLVGGGLEALGAHRLDGLGEPTELFTQYDEG